MLRAVLDSSVLISAFLTPRGTTAEVFRAQARGAFVLCLSPEIIAETTRKLLEKGEAFRRRYAYTDAEIGRFALVLWTTAELVTKLPDLSGAVPLDPKDDAIVATAVAARADCLVTGDRRHLLSLGTCEGVRIMSVREFLDIVSRP